MKIRRLADLTAIRNASRVGFVGLGVMGSNMARNLIEKGRELVVYDVNEKATEQAVKSGKAKRVNSPREVAEQSDGPVFTMLPNNKICLDVYSDPSIGLIAGAKKGNYLIDCSTVSPDLSKTLYERSKAAGVLFHDAPVAGAEPAAIGKRERAIKVRKSKAKNYSNRSLRFQPEL